MAKGLFYVRLHSFSLWNSVIELPLETLFYCNPCERKKRKKNMENVTLKIAEINYRETCL